MTDTFDSIGSEYFSLPCLKDMESVHNWNGYRSRSNENIQNIIENNYDRGRSNSVIDLTVRSTDEITDYNGCNFPTENIETSYRHRINQENSSDNEINSGIENITSNVEPITKSRYFKQVSINDSKPGSSCEEITSENNSDKGYFSSCDVIGKQSQDTFYYQTHNENQGVSLNSNGDYKKIECQTVATIESRGRNSYEYDTTNTNNSREDSFEQQNDNLQRPTSLPLGNPPSYMEALRCSPLVYSLPYDINISRSRASLFTLESNIYDTYLDSDPITTEPTMENAPRLVAFPSIHAIHTISRSSATTPCVTPDDGISQETIVPASEGFDDHPCAAYCKSCQITVLTTTSTSYRSATYCCCFLMFFSGVCCPFSFLPFFLCGPKKVYHMCPQCKDVMGIFIDN